MTLCHGITEYLRVSSARQVLRFNSPYPAKCGKAAACWFTVLAGLLLMLCLTGGCTPLVFYLPSFEGVVVDDDTGQPIEGALVVSDDSFFYLSQMLNVGGASPTLDRTTVSTIDNRGWFHVPCYISGSLVGLAPSRHVEIYRFPYSLIILRQSFDFQSTYGKVVSSRGCYREDSYAMSRSGSEFVFRVRTNPEQSARVGDSICGTRDWMLYLAKQRAWFDFTISRTPYRAIYSALWEQSADIRLNLPDDRSRGNWDSHLLSLRQKLQESGQESEWASPGYKWPSVFAGGPDSPIASLALPENATDADIAAALNKNPQVQNLSLSRTRVTDSGLELLKDLKGLKQLNLYGTKITDAGLAHLGGISGMQSLGLSETQVTDAGLVYLEEMKGLKVLYLSCYRVTDGGLAHLAGLVSLQKLYLNSRVTDAGLVNLEEMLSLQVLDLGGAKVTDAGLAHLEHLEGIKDLRLSTSKVTDAGLIHLHRMYSLENLNLGQTQLTDAGLAQLKEFTCLKELEIYNTKITDAGLEQLVGMASLQSLNLLGDKLTDAGMMHLKELKALRTLRLDGTQVTDAGIRHLKELKNLQTLFLGGTQVTDAAIGDLKEMQSLQLISITQAKLTRTGLADLRAALPKAKIF